MKDFMERISSIATLIVSSFIICACGGPIKDGSVREEITREIPPFLKISELDLGETSGEQNSFQGWFVEAPFKLKLEFSDNTYGKDQVRFDYRNKSDKVLFVKNMRRVGEVLEFNGVARMNYEKSNSGKVIQKLAVEIKKFISQEYGDILENFKKDYAHVYPNDSNEAREWKEGYADVVKNARAVFPGEWDNGIYYSKDGLCIIIPTGGKTPIQRKWEVTPDGILKTYEGGTAKSTNDLIVCVSDNEITLRDMDRINGALNTQKKLNTTSQLQKEGGSYARNLIGVWDTNWYNAGAIGIIREDGSLIFNQKNSSGGLSGKFEKGTWKFIDNHLYIDISETEEGKSDWKRYFKVLAADGKSFKIQQVSLNAHDKSALYEGKLLRSIEENLKYENMRADALKRKILGKWKWHVAKGYVNAPMLANTRYPHKSPELDVFSTFEENGTFTHSFFFKPGQRGPYYPANIYKGGWEINGESIIITLTEKDGKVIPSETYKYFISEKKGAENLEMNPVETPKGIMRGTIYRSKIGGEGPLAPTSRESDNSGANADSYAQNVSEEEADAQRQIQSLIEDTNNAVRMNSELASENSSSAAQKARKMKEETIPDLEKKISSVRRCLAANSGKIGSASFSSIVKSLKECQNKTDAIKQNLSKYSTLEEGIDNIKNVGSKILDLF